jgi:hypothetical protein
MTYYADDCICPDCINCDVENDKCNIGRWRYPTDGCFDFVDKDHPDDPPALELMIKAVMEASKKC